MHYGVDPRFRGKGYASEGVRAVLARALAEEGAPGVAAIIAHENEASRRVALAAGMVQMGPLNGATLFGITRPQMAPTPEAPVRSGPLRKAPSPIYRPILFRLAAYAWTVPYARRTLNWVIAAFMA